MTAPMSAVSIPIRRLAHGHDLALPQAASAEAAGMDLLAAVEGSVTLAPGARQLVPTGIAIALPAGYEAQVRPRSGLAVRHGVTVLNSPGTVDSDYRGEIGVVLINHGQSPFVVERGMRIAQLVVAPITSVQWAERTELPASGRAAGGFGSTGVS